MSARQRRAGAQEYPPMRGAIPEDFPVTTLMPRRAVLEGTISCNSLARAALSLRYGIDIDLAPMPASVARGKPAMNLWDIELDSRSWRGLASRSFGFSRHPLPRLVDGEPCGYVDAPSGSLRISDAHDEVRLTKIEFGELSRVEKGRYDVAARLQVEIRFRDERYRPAELTLEVAMTIGAISIFGDIARVDGVTRREALEMAQRFVDLADYEVSVIDGVVRLDPGPITT